MKTFKDIKIGEEFDYNISCGFEKYTKIEEIEKAPKGGYYNAIRHYDNKKVVFRDKTEVF